MGGISAEVLLVDILWVLVVVGWIILIATGLEADKPLSGGLPGHVDYGEAHGEHHWNSVDRFGATAAWVCFGLAAACLPIVLWWIFRVHELPH